MNLKEKIQADLKKSLKKKETSVSLVLRGLVTAITNRQKEKRYRLIRQKPDLTDKELQKQSQLTNEEVIEVAMSEAKKRKEAILAFEKGKRQDLAEKEKKELQVLQKYLPEQLSKAEIKKIAQAVIKKIKASSPQDMGKVMSALMPEVKGKAEGALVSKVVKELLNVGF